MESTIQSTASFEVDVHGCLWVSEKDGGTSVYASGRWQCARIDADGAARVEQL